MLRREFILGGVGAAFALVNFDASRPSIAEADNSLEQNPFFIGVKEEDPVFRAANMNLRTRHDSGKYFIGKGGLIRHNEILGIMTVYHVIRDMNQLTIQIPGSVDTVLEKEYLEPYQKGTDAQDATVFMTLPKDYTALLEDAIRTSVLSPLKIATSGVTKDEYLALPNTTIGYDLFQVEKTDAYLSQISLKSPAFVPVCGGKSGTPLCKVVGNQVIPEVAGVIRGYYTYTRLSTDPSTRESRCGMGVTATDISPFTK